ncbi:MAG: pLS20_p028 family conjugation system transmembrane protein, partial [Acutalibacteraceae bacterium]
MFLEHWIGEGIGNWIADLFLPAPSASKGLTEQLKYWSDALSMTGFFQDILWYMGWTVTLILKIICNFAEEALNVAYKLLDFTNYDIVSNVFGGAKNWKAILTILFAVGLVIVGYTLLINKEQKPQFLQSLVLLIAVFIALPTLFNVCNSVVKSTKSYILGDSYSASEINIDVTDPNSIYESAAEGNISDQIVINGITDYLYIEKQGLKNYAVDNSYVYAVKDKKLNNFNQKSISYIDINEKIETTDDTNRIFNYKIKLDEDGKATAVKLEKAETGFDWLNGLFSENYRRYDVKFFSVWVFLICMTFALLFTSFKTVRIIYELVVNRCLVMLISPVDLTTGRKTKAILQNIISSYVIMVITVILLKLFIEFFVFMQTTITSSFIQAVLVIAVTMAVIDGPNIVERIFGIDAGIQSGYKTMMTMLVGTRVGGKLVSAVGHTIGGVATKAASSGAKGVKSNIATGKSNINSNAANSEDDSKSSVKTSDNEKDNKGNNTENGEDNKNNLSSTDEINGNKNTEQGSVNSRANNNIDSSVGINEKIETTDDSKPLNNDGEQSGTNDNSAFNSNNISSTADINGFPQSQSENDGRENLQSDYKVNNNTDKSNLGSNNFSTKNNNAKPSNQSTKNNIVTNSSNIPKPNLNPERQSKLNGQPINSPNSKNYNRSNINIDINPED